MSVQFGRCNFSGKPVVPEDLDQVRPVLAPYGPDGEEYICKDNIGILYRAFHTTSGSRREIQPWISASGSVFTWDGRLDNREDLTRDLRTRLSQDPTDLEIVSAAHEHWGVGAFARLIGDWAVSIWDPRNQSLVLAKDFVGTRHLFYSIDKEQVAWSTLLDPLVLCAKRSFVLEEEYIAGWLSLFPAPHLTPYVGIHAVPPSAFVTLTRGKRTVTKYWDFDPSQRIRYGTDREYEEHFRAVFSQAVQRRFRSDRPVLCELSGGMDSSSIVCMADWLRTRGTGNYPEPQTLSYYNDTEPNWDERRYFELVEKQRGTIGYHIDTSSHPALDFESDHGNFEATPSSSGQFSKARHELHQHLVTHGYRVLLSGIGGDEVLGGVPAPGPELADHFVSAQLRTLAHQLVAWALVSRKPILKLITQSARPFLPARIFDGVPHRARTTWLEPKFARRYGRALLGYPTRLHVFGALPSFQENLFALDMLRRQLACSRVSSDPPYEKRYPYIDRTLLEFLFAIPRQQILRPAQRRSLMRRALVGIVPEEILNRKRKAFVARAPVVEIRGMRPAIHQLLQNMATASLRIVDRDAFAEAVDRTCEGKETPLVPMIRTLTIEYWLRNLQESHAGVFLQPGGYRPAAITN